MRRKVTPIFKDSFQKRYWRQMIVITVVLCLGLGAVFWWLHQRSDRPSELQYPILGMQLSQTDGYQDFNDLKKEGLQFVYLKATEGASYKDDNFDTNYSRANGSGLSVGIFHFFSFDSSPKRQADQLFKAVGQQTGKLPIMIYLDDYNDYAQQPPKKKKTQASLAQLVALINQHYQQDCIIGGEPVLLRRYVPQNGTYPLWQVTRTRPTLTTKSGFWQYTTGSPIPKSNRQTDYQLAVFTGSKHQWQLLK
ncbi:GH25 family lysozyme [Latilactobacillus graminis]|uniref:Glycosyl hydrolases 25 family protein n=2 Tax=Latilactobacillus graminis TaxID=60519 RepID=A0AA89I137_9LACO|nr:GH25 family lysozyme [Latilactobacillus graminis]KRM21001.1 glycosyl hydrolases 25 family protein [Latilactobacillus graminis DSM 20719]QFP79139.1 glycosyl hydrolase [Latilactobacillus graminis]